MDKVESNFLGTFSEKELERQSKHHTLISLFSGCGGAALGFCQAGFEVRVFVEKDKWACETLRRNWTDEDGSRTVKYKWQKRIPAILQVDITKTTTAEILRAGDLKVGEATALEGGFPCQGFSIGNVKRDKDDHTKDKRNLLYLECVRVIKEALPRTFMLENVPGLVSMEKGKVIKMICDDLSWCGYGISWSILNAAEYGVPQNRKRVFIIGTRQDVMCLDAETGNMALHIGAVKGNINHPSWFKKKYRYLFDTQLKIEL